jgi:hypothetical protein
VDKPLVVVMTPDRNTDAAVRRAFDADGSTHSMSVATIVINGTSSLLHFGTHALEQGCDIFQLCMRVHASPAQTSAGAFQAYLGRRFPLMIVEPDFAAPDAPLYPIADRPIRQGLTTEADLVRRRGDLADAVVQRMGRLAGLRLKLSVPFSPVELDKRRCLLDGSYHPYGTGNCYGTSSDGRYTLSDHYTMPRETNHSSLAGVVVVVGANHAATGNAADNQLLHGKTVALNPQDLEGSAQFFLGAAASKSSDAGLCECTEAAVGSLVEREPDIRRSAVGCGEADWLCAACCAVARRASQSPTCSPRAARAISGARRAATAPP